MVRKHPACSRKVKMTCPMQWHWARPQIKDVADIDKKKTNLTKSRSELR